MCLEDTCVEGCQLKPCPENQIYTNDSYTECVAKSICKPECLKINDIVYNEGDIIRSDACHTCRCTRGKEVCSGEPCSIVQLPTEPPRPYKDGGDKCMSGWTIWFNQDKAGIDGMNKPLMKIGDKEPLPNEMFMRSFYGSPVCGVAFMKQIECRTVGTQLAPKILGEDVECSLEKGLLCAGPCHDYEIRVLCDCGDEIEIFTLPPVVPVHKLPPLPVSDGKYKQLTTPVPVMPAKPAEPVIRSPCDPGVPHIEFPGDCYKFLHCEPDIDGSWKYAEKTCGPSMMYNPKYMICDWPSSVIAMKPWCGEPQTTAVPIPILPPTLPPFVVPVKCPPGQVWSECAVPCGKACHYYGQMLQNLGSCAFGSKACIEGCVDALAILSCPIDYLWRDNRACVAKADCTCISRGGKLVKVNALYCFLTIRYS